MKSYSRAGLFAVAIGAVALPTQAHCEVWPTQLRGKSITWGWTESRVQRRVGAAEWQTQNESYTMEIYYSSAGRRFGRLGSNLMRKPIEAAGPPTGRFQGRTLVTYYRGAANTRTRQFLVSFDESYSTCDAKVISGKPAGSDTFLMATDTPGVMLEARSITITATTCAIRDGNTFAQ